MNQLLTKQSPNESFSSEICWSIYVSLLTLCWCLVHFSLLLQVCDTFLKYGLPLVVMPPPGVFYPALFATDPVSVDRLAYIMYRWGLFISMLQHAISRS